MDYVKLYADFLKKFIKPRRKLKVVFDSSNGTTGIILKELLKTYKLIDFKLINWRPDGRFPAHGPNPLLKGATAQLEREVMKLRRWDGAPTAKRVGADLGVIFDGDGDRVFFIDNRGRWIDAHEAGYILMKSFKSPYVVSALSSWRLKKFKVESLKSPPPQEFDPPPEERADPPPAENVYVSRVGHYFFKQMMRRNNASLGLEHSGHYYFRDFFYCDAGIFAAISIINFVSRLDGNLPPHLMSFDSQKANKNSGKLIRCGGLADWLDELPKYYRSGEINFKIKDKKGILKKIEKIYKNQGAKIIKLDGLTVEFCGPSLRSGQNSAEFWFNLRPSNTEDLLRLNMESTDKKVLRDKLAELKSNIK